MYSKSTRLAAACAVSVFVSATSVNAQSDDDPFADIDFVRVDQRVDPVPLLIWGFDVQPRVDFSGGYTSNLFATEINETGSSLFGFAPGLDINSRWAKHGLTARFLIDHTENAENTDERHTDLLMSLDGYIDLGDGAQLSGSFVGEIETEDRTEFSAISTALKPNEYSRLAGGLGFTHTTGAWDLDADLTYSIFDHDDAVILDDLFQDQDFRDRDELTGRFRLVHPVGSNWSAYGEVEHIQATFDPPGFFNAFNRDYGGSTVSIGSTFAVGDTVKGDIGFGFMRYVYDDPFFQDIEDIAVSGNVSWLLASNTSLETEVSRAVIDPGIIQTIAAIETGLDVKLVHGVTPRVFLIGAAGVNTYEFENIDRTDDRIDLSLGANWRVNKNLWLESQVEYLDASSPVQPFTDNRVMIRMRVFP